MAASGDHEEQPRKASPIADAPRANEHAHAHAQDTTAASADAADPPLPDEEAPPLPDEAPPSEDDDGWEPRWDNGAQAWYFFNRRTQVSQWENPRVPSASTHSYGQYDRFANISSFRLSFRPNT